MVENIIFDFNVSRMEKQKDIFDYIRLYKFGEIMLEIDGLIPQQILNSCKIIYIVSGMGIIKSPDKESQVVPGDIYIASKGTTHSVKSNSNSRLRYMYFSFELLSNAPEELKKFYEEIGNAVVKDEMRSGPLYNMLFNEFYSEKLMSNQMCEYVMKVILLSGYRNCCDKSSVMYSPDVSM